MRNDPFLSNYMIVRSSISENFKISFSVFAYLAQLKWWVFYCANGRKFMKTEINSSDDNALLQSLYSKCHVNN